MWFDIVKTNQRLPRYNVHHSMANSGPTLGCGQIMEVLYFSIQQVTYTKTHKSPAITGIWVFSVMHSL